jgi:hypothetical protein
VGSLEGLLDPPTEIHPALVLEAGQRRVPPQTPPVQAKEFPHQDGRFGRQSPLVGIGPHAALYRLSDTIL